MTIRSRQIKKEGQSLTLENMIEFSKCADDPAYFIEHYLKFPNSAADLPTVLRPYQKVQLAMFRHGGPTITVQPRSSGATIVPLMYLFWAILFKPNYSAQVIVMNEYMASYFVSALAGWYEQRVPDWLKSVVQLESVSLISGSIRFNTGSKIDFGFSSSALCESSSDLTFIDSLGSMKADDQDTLWTEARIATKRQNIILTGMPTGSANTFAAIWRTSMEFPNLVSGFRVQPSDVYSSSQLDFLRKALSTTMYKREIECDFTV